MDEMNLDLAAYDGQHLPFADESFDVITSNAVLEHVHDLPFLSKEMYRVAKDHGICYHLWHNYYSVSGAHVPDEIALTKPWGHLTGDSRVDSWLKLSGTYLNKKMPYEIVCALSNDFNSIAVHRLDKNHNVEGVDDGFECEGDGLLTSGIYSATGVNSREVLLTRAYSFIGKKDRI